jgi:hypothetical protein
MSLALKTRMNYADKQNEILAIGTFVSQNGINFLFFIMFFNAKFFFFFFL